MTIYPDEPIEAREAQVMYELNHMKKSLEEQEALIAHLTQQLEQVLNPLTGTKDSGAIRPDEDLSGLAPLAAQINRLRGAIEINSSKLNDVLSGIEV